MKNSNVRMKKMIAWICAFALSFVSILPANGIAQVQAKGAGDKEHVLQSPVIAADDGRVTWDCVYFGNYWQSKYIARPGNRPEAGEDDVVHTDTDGTKYLVRADKNCYRYDPIKWRVLSVSEDGTDAFLVADKVLDIQSFNSSTQGTLTWENSELRTWLNNDFMTEAFTESEQDAIVETDVENKKNSYLQNESLADENNTSDKLYLLSLEEATTRAYGFTTDLETTETRDPNDASTDFVESGGFSGYEWSWNDYWLRTQGDESGNRCFVSHNGSGSISFSMGVSEKRAVRPVLHLDLTKTELWTYAGQVKQDKTEISPNATPIVATPTPTPRPGVTMAPNLVFPKNPIVNKTDLYKNTWDCIYFGKYYNTKFTPSTLSPAADHDMLVEDKNGDNYLVRHNEGYFRYEPIKWRVLSINKDGTDAFLMADKVLDVRPYYDEDDVEVTWEKSNIRTWLNNDFQDAAFTESEKNAILDSTVITEDNPWSGEPGGNDTTDKIYLPSIEESLNPSYGFSSDETEPETRKMEATDYAKAEKRLEWAFNDVNSYWLRSPGSSAGRPAYVGIWENGEIPQETANGSTEKLGVRPVIHVDLTDTNLWTYAGQVTPEGVVYPSVKQPTKTPVTNVKPQVSTPTKQTIKKPGKPTIKKLKNKSGKKLTITLKKKVSGATGYQVAYATNKKFKKKKTKKFSKTSVTLKKLKKKKKYYVKVRAYKKSGKKVVYGSWSKVKSIKIKK